MAVDPQLIQEAKRLRLKKRFSQNFLVDAQVLDAIVTALEPNPNDTVVEIGAGAGFLTERVLPQVGHLTAIEVERRMIQYLGEKFAEAPNLSIVAQDVMKFPFEAVEASQFKVVGNLPYAITSPILFRLIGELHQRDYPLRQRLQKIVLMVQKEVGVRMSARPGTKAYNPLSIATQFWFEPRLVTDVPPKAFLPAPKVTSVVVVLTPRKQPRVAVDNVEDLHRLIRAAFAQRRKTLWNTLRSASLVPEPVLATLLETVSIDRQCRADAISIETFGALANVYTQYLQTAMPGKGQPVS